MADTDDWATEKARELLYCICSGADPYAPTPACGCPEYFRDAVASALRDVRREALEEAATAYDRFGENAEHNYHVQIDAGDLDAAGRWADIRDSHDNVARHLRALAADRKDGGK